MREIPLTRGMVAIVDDDVAEMLLMHKWQAKKGRHTYYAVRNSKKCEGKSRRIWMHRQIMGITDPKIHGDHVDGNGLNNLMENLREASCLQNSFNRNKQTNNTSGFKGVSKVKGRLRWEARIQVGDKITMLGYYFTPEAAAIAYNEAAVKHYGEFAKLNDVDISHKAPYIKMKPGKQKTTTNG